MIYIKHVYNACAVSVDFEVTITLIKKESTGVESCVLGQATVGCNSLRILIAYFCH